MPIRSIKVPKTLTIELREDTTEDYPFYKFVQGLLNLPEWGKDWRSIQYAMEIDEAVSKCIDAVPLVEVVEISGEAFDILKATVEAPTNGYPWPPALLRQFGPYFEAIVEAKKKKK